MKSLERLFVFLLLGWQSFGPPTARANPAVKPQGIRFECTKDELGEIDEGLTVWMKTQSISSSLWHRKGGTEAGFFQYELASGRSDTLTLADKLKLGTEAVRAKRADGTVKTLDVASRKEILLSMMAPGRVFYLRGKDCRVKSLLDHVDLLQNTAYWAGAAKWTFPADGICKANPLFWETVWRTRPGVRASSAIADAFSGKFAYEVGCTKAAGLVALQGIFDYYNHRKRDATLAKRLDEISGREPFKEMATVYSDASELHTVARGKYFRRHTEAPWDHWVVGDWGWIKNTDPVSRETVGLEGSNLIYIGGGKFTVFWEGVPARSLDEFLQMVYTWRAVDKREPITPALMDKLRKDPAEGGLLRTVRDFAQFEGEI